MNPPQYSTAVDPPRGPAAYPRRSSVPDNSWSPRPPSHDYRRRIYPATSPCPAPRPKEPNFTVELLRGAAAGNHHNHHRRVGVGDGVDGDLKGLIAKLKHVPQGFVPFRGGSVAGRLFFEEWVQARETMVSLWELRSHGVHLYIPRLCSAILLPSDRNELRDDLKSLFANSVRRILDGDLVRKWQKKLEHVLDQIEDVKQQFRKLSRLVTFTELIDKQKRLISERDLIVKRISEFKSAMNCILNHLEGKESHPDDDEGGGMEFSFHGDFCWSKINSLINRECRRLEAGLPIYAFRKQILRQIRFNQVTVLIGETGSGKSTQLVQFLADSGVGADKSIVCTQPRKIAAVSLARRVAEESLECYNDDSIICCPTSSSLHHFDAKVIYMTDHCLLQHYMNDKNLSGISCIVVDEAHERSLNTDLLLALLKNFLLQNPDLRLIIMSATADANQLSDYFWSCKTFHVLGRCFPVEVRYVPSTFSGFSPSGPVASYASDVLRLVSDIDKTENEGTILVFLTSQLEVEWACDNFDSCTAVSLPLHGKLSFEEQFRVFQNYPGRRKVIFTTNIAETSLTIPGVKYVVDSGLVKESRFDPGSGMNILRVCWTNKSSANQRTGRAGRTEPGICYRLYSESDYEVMPPHMEPEIRRVHLGVAVLRILALGIENCQDFDFIDAPSVAAIDMAIRNLIQLGAVVRKNEVMQLTDDGRYFAKLGIEPRLGRLIIGCFNHRLGREGLVLASVMANASSIFCRVGKVEDKIKSDCLKVQFCHRHGDLFTLLSVYKAWEDLPQVEKNKWCWENSINAKSMRRCQDTLKELEQCLQNEVSVIIPSYWRWNPNVLTDHDKNLKKVILSSLSENVAMYSGYDRLGYEVAFTGQNVQLHPSCSLLMFSQKPQWVVFSEILSISSQYLVCVTAFDLESLSTLSPPPEYDISKIESRMLQERILTGFGTTQLKRFCGKSNSSLLHLLSIIRINCMDQRIGIEVNCDQNEILVYARSQDMERAINITNDALEYSRKLLQNECLEKLLYNGGPGVSPSIALFGAGAQIMHLELEKRYLTVDISYSNVNSIEDKELLSFFEKFTSGSICGFQKFSGTGQENEKESSFRVTFLTPGAAKKAFELNGCDFGGSVLRVNPQMFGIDNRLFSFPAVKAKVYWPRRLSKGFAIAKFDPGDVSSAVDDFLYLFPNSHCEPGKKGDGSVVISKLDRSLSDAEILKILRISTDKKIRDVFVLRGEPVDTLPCGACEEALFREISPFMPRRNSSNCCRIQVFPPEPKDYFMRGEITFDGRLHLEAAKALEQIEGKVLPGCLPWQKISCQQLFHSSVSCSGSIFPIIEKQLESLLASFKCRKGVVECILNKNDNGSYRVKISANATRTVAELRRPVEELMKGKPISDASLTPAILQLLFSRDGIALMKKIQQMTGTFIFFDRHKLEVRVFGPPYKFVEAQKSLTESLLALNESKQHEIRLRGGDLPHDMMKQVVKAFGPELQGLKEKVPEADFTLNTRYHTISYHGNKELKPKVEEILYGIAQSSGGHLSEGPNAEVASCPICLCEVEDSYRLEGCPHSFCRSCLVEQCESAIKSQDSFPICCTHEGCRVPILLTDLRSLLCGDKLEELFRAALGAYVASSGGKYRFCPSPDCPAVYQVADPGMPGEPFVCGACYAETCTRCHLEHHPYISCERYREFKDDPDSSLKEWCKGKEHVKHCPVCGYTIEKVDGCNHIECRCGKHICWNCLEFYETSDDCYTHLRSIHQAIV